MSNLVDLIRRLPKAELHLHIEGTLEPGMMMELAAKHGVQLPYSSVEIIKNAYNFSNLQSFLDLYYLGASVLRDEDDFYRLMSAYLERCRLEGIVHTEMMFDPQTHTSRGVDFSVFMSGFERARREALERSGVSSLLIMCFLRHLSQDEAISTLEASTPFRDQIYAVGLDSSEIGYPPEKFKDVFREAANYGYARVAHAGEEGSAKYISSALDVLEVVRIDHGVRCLEEPELVARLVSQQTPLTVCPLSNVRLCVYEHMRNHPILSMLEKGLNVSVNSDDPSYFGGYLVDNFAALESSLGMSEEQARQLIANSIRGSFVEAEKREAWLQEVKG